MLDSHDGADAQDTAIVLRDSMHDWVHDTDGADLRRRLDVSQAAHSAQGQLNADEITPIADRLTATEARMGRPPTNVTPRLRAP